MASQYTKRLQKTIYPYRDLFTFAGKQRWNPAVELPRIGYAGPMEVYAVMLEKLKENEEH